MVGRTGCGKTTFLEKLAINKFFGEIVKTEWVSGIEIDESREAEIQSCFSNETEVYIATEKDDLDNLIEKFKQVKQDNDNVNISNSFGELKKMDRLIVLDDVSGVADLSKKFANFLTVSRKYGYNVVYVFHVIIPSNILIPSYQHRYLLIQYRKFYKQIVFLRVKVTLQFVYFGLQDYLLSLQIVTRNIV